MIINEVLNTEEINFLKKHISNVNYNRELTSDEFEDFYSKVEDLYTLQGFDESYDLNDIGKAAEPIIDKLAKY